MKLFARLRSWFKWIAKPQRLEDEMETEVQFHIESYAADLVRSGVPQQEAKRQAHSGGRPVRQATESPPPDCRTVGPFPCFQPGINILAAAATAAEMARRVATGQEIGSMFLTDPQPDEYHLYLMAKARREAEEAAKAAATKAKAAGQPQPTPTPQPASH